MQDNWYAPRENGDAGWYALPEKQTAPAAAGPAAVRPRRTHQGLKVTMIVLSVLILIAASCLIFSGKNGGLLSRNTGDAGDSSGLEGLLPDAGSDSGDYAKDFRDYFKQYYDSTDTTTKECTIPAVAALPDGVSVELEPQGDTALTLQQIYVKCAPSVVAITAYVAADNDDSYYWGTGIVLTDDGYILTNAHVVEGTCRAKITLWDDSEYDALLVGYDSRSDIAVLKIEASGLTPAEFCDSSTLTVGDSVVALGNPLGEQFRSTMTDGIISGIDRDISYNGTTLTLIQTSAPINEGNSGGPLLNQYGQVVGITNMKMSASYYGSASIEGVGFAIPSHTIKEMADALLTKGQVTGRPALGITVGPIPTGAADHYNLPEGLYVSAVAGGSDCAAKGVQAGDILLAVDGETVTETKQVTEHIKDMDVGDTLVLTLWRDGSTFDVTVALVDVNDVY